MSARLLRSAVAALAAAAVLSGCGSSPGAATTRSRSAPSGGVAAASSAAPSEGSGCAQVGSVKFDKSKFVLHAGLAFGAFHHFIYQPAKAHNLHGVLTLGKAALATGFTVHELKLAKADAESSPTLCKLVAPFDRAATALTADTDKIKHGNVSSTDLEPVQSDLASAQAQAKAGGTPAPDIVPSPSQLRTG
jgi:hypothetical protein